jgi:hypothetical protein
MDEKGILQTEKRYRKEPLAPQGYTHDYRYTLRAPFVHRPSPKRGAQAVSTK